jgi:protein subunit release factor B
MREHLLSLSKKDFTITTFKSGGKGGQHQNKTDSGVRIKHNETGMWAESRDGKSQHQNKKIAFQRLTSSPAFVSWLNMKSREIITKKTIEQKVEEMMNEDYIKVEVKVNGKWVDVKDVEKNQEGN